MQDFCMTSKTKILSADPGKSGYFCKLDPATMKLEFYPYPMLTVGKNKKDYDPDAMYQLVMDLVQDVRLIVIENVHAMQGGTGGSSNFSFGFGKGLLVMAAVASQTPRMYVSPQAWQKLAWLGVTKVQKPSGTHGKMVTDTKATSLIAAKRLFPGETFLASERSKKPHDGMVDAALIAYYGSKN